MDENVAESFLKELNESSDPASVLIKLYSVVTDTNDNYGYLPAFRKFVKLFGRKNMFYSILDLVEVDVKGSPLKLIAWFCKRRIEQSVPDPVAEIDVSNLRKRIDKMNSRR